jgi:MFS transporter, PAT family, beta-lactamase induction signal transducer AmpG
MAEADSKAKLAVRGASGEHGPVEAAPKRSRRALAWVSTSNFGEGLPWSVLHQMGTEFLTEARASSTVIGSTSLFHLAVTLKFLWSPVVDLFGRKRSWLVVTQLVLAAGMVAVGAAVSRSMPPWFAPFWIVASFFAVVHATHDIACDGFYIEALDRRDQALYSGVRVASFRAAMIVGSSGLVVLASRAGWFAAFAAAGGIMLVTALVNRALLPRPASPAPAFDAAKPGAKAAAFWGAYRTFVAQPRAVLVLSFMFFYKLGDIMMFAMSKPLLRDIGVNLGQRGLLNGLGTTSFIAGSLVGGALVARRGLERTLVPMLYVQNFAIPLYVLMAVVKPAFGGVLAIVLTEQLVAGIGSAAHVMFLIQRTRRAFSASHFAFATAVVSLGSTLSGYLSGPLDDHFGHPIFFTLAFVASWPALALVWFVPKGPAEAAAEPAA